jgi:hypothetical protein
MTKPLEIIHQNFQIKLDQIEELFSVLGELKSQKVYNKYKTIKNDFETQSLEILGDYFISETIELKKNCVEKFMELIITQNYISQLDEIVQNIKDYILKEKIDITTKIQIALKKYTNTPIDIDVELDDYNACILCKTGKMILFPNDSEMRCDNCAHIQTLKGMTFDDNLHTNSEGTITKRGAYETSRRFRFHLDRILAKKSPQISDEIWTKINAWIKVNNFQHIKTLSCKDLRRCFKDIKETHLNEHAPFIRQKLTGIGPERLYHYELDQLIILFDKADMAFKRINGDSRANLKYYPYFIYKILEIILNKPEDQTRLWSIIECIHFQQTKTLISNDKLWQQICDIVPEFKGKFKKTDKNLL